MSKLFLLLFLVASTTSIAHADEPKTCVNKNGTNFCAILNIVGNVSDLNLKYFDVINPTDNNYDFDFGQYTAKEMCEAFLPIMAPGFSLAEGARPSIFGHVIETQKKVTKAWVMYDNGNCKLQRMVRHVVTAVHCFATE